MPIKIWCIIGDTFVFSISINFFEEIINPVIIYILNNIVKKFSWSTPQYKHQVELFFFVFLRITFFREDKKGTQTRPFEAYIRKLTSNFNSTAVLAVEGGKKRGNSSYHALLGPFFPFNAKCCTY